MEVDGIAAQSEGLTHVEELHILDVGMGGQLVRDGGVDHNLTPKLVTAHLLPETALETGLCCEFSCRTRNEELSEHI